MPRKRRLRLPAGFVKLLHQIKLPFNVNRLASVAAIAALNDKSHVEDTLKLNRQERKFLCNIFNNLNLEYIKSYTNFVTIKLDNADKAYEHLLDNGIITRPLVNYGLSNYLRITIGTNQQNKTLVTTLSEYLK